MVDQAELFRAGEFILVGIAAIANLVWLCIDWFYWHNLHLEPSSKTKVDLAPEHSHWDLPVAGVALARQLFLVCCI
jgi:hypothetical protein